MSQKNRKLGRTSDQRRAMLRAMVTYLLGIKSIILFTRQRQAHHGQLVDDLLQGLATKEDVANKLFKEIGPKYADRNGGYTRVVRIGPRRGDAAAMAIIQGGRLSGGDPDSAGAPGGSTLH